MSEKETATKKQLHRAGEHEVFNPPRPAPREVVDLDDGIGFPTGKAAGRYSAESPGDMVEDWSPLLPKKIFKAFRAALKIAGMPAPGVALVLVLDKQTVLNRAAELTAVFVHLLRESAKAGPSKRITLDLTNVLELIQALQMRDRQQQKGSIAADEAVAALNAFGAELDVLQLPVREKLEPYLRKLPLIRFASVEEKQRVEESLGVLLARLGQRVVRYDTEKAAPVAEEPSLLRCITNGDGYFRLEYFQDGKKHRTGIGPNLPPLTLAPSPPDSRRRKK